MTVYLEVIPCRVSWIYIEYLNSYVWGELSSFFIQLKLYFLFDYGVMFEQNDEHVLIRTLSQTDVHFGRVCLLIC